MEGSPDGIEDLKGLYRMSNGATNVVELQRTWFWATAA
jgi:hypothetical protein